MTENIIQSSQEIILQGGQLSREDALALWDADLEALCSAADLIRAHFCGNAFDLCTIINGKSGRCSENCKYCAQAGCYHTDIESYPLLSTEEILPDAQKNDRQGVLRYSIVTSGKRLSDAEVEEICDAIRAIRRETSLEVCASFGLLDEPQLQAIKDAGVSRIHNNLETSRRHFAEVCSTHTYDDKIATIHAAQHVGLNVCSGGILGIGETIEDRIDMVLELRALGIRSIPVNVLNPIPGTPYEKNPPLSLEEIRRTIAIFRFLVPDASIRLAGGRGLMPDQGISCFRSGANAAISGDMLTTSGITVAKDLQILKELGYQPELWTR